MTTHKAGKVCAQDKRWRTKTATAAQMPTTENTAVRHSPATVTESGQPGWFRQSVSRHRGVAAVVEEREVDVLDAVALDHANPEIETVVAGEGFVVSAELLEAFASDHGAGAVGGAVEKGDFVGVVAANVFDDVCLFVDEIVVGEDEADVGFSFEGGREDAEGVLVEVIVGVESQFGWAKMARLN